MGRPPWLAPPIIALVGLLGFLRGEQVPPLIGQAWAIAGLVAA